MQRRKLGAMMWLMAFAFGLFVFWNSPRPHALPDLLGLAVLSASVNFLLFWFASGCHRRR